MESILKLRSFLSEKLKNWSNLAIILMIIVSIAETMGIALLVPILSALISPDNNIQNFLKEYLSFFEKLSKNDFILLSFSFVVIIYILKNIFLLFFLRFRSYFEANCQKYFAAKLYKTYLKNSYEFHMSNNSSILLRNITIETDNIKHASNASITFIAEILIFIGIISFLLFFDFKFTLILLITLLIIAFIFIYYIKPKLNNWGSVRLEEAGKINKKVTDALQNIKLIKLWEIENKFFETFDLSNFQRTEMVRKLSFWNGVPKILFETILIVSILTFFLYTFFTGMKSSQIFIYIAVYGVSALKIIPSCNAIFSSIITIQFTKPSILKIINEIEKDSKNIKQETVRNIEMNFQNKIILKNVSYSYPNSNHQALEKINLEINNGDKIGIYGPSGSGKSTLVDIIMGIIKPREGSIFLNNEKLLNNVDYSWRKNIGYIQQNILLFDDSLINNINLNSKDNLKEDKKLESVLKRSKVESFISNLPNGVNTNLGERGLKLSGGQRQRIGIARALYHNPEILILDESTNQLDDFTEKEIIKDIFQEFHKKTILMISHNYDLLLKCDKIVHVIEGKIEKIDELNEKKNINSN